MFQQLLANKHHRLRDFKAPITIWPSGGLGLVTDKKTKKKNKSRVKQEPRSAHGRAVNKWAVNIFAEWQRLRGVKGPVLDCGGLFKDYDLHKVTAVSVDIAGMDALSLNYWLSKFVMEVAKKSGERYPPKSVYGIICALKRYLEEKNGSEALNPLDASDKRYLTTFRPNWLVI